MTVAILVCLAGALAFLVDVFFLVVVAFLWFVKP